MANIERLKKLYSVIEESPPERVDMAFWFWNPHVRASIQVRDLKEARTQCDTTYCLAGFTVDMMLKENLETRAYFIDDQAADYLGLSPEQKDSLFDVYNWPEPFSSNYSSEPVRAKRATLARLDHLIKTGE